MRTTFTFELGRRGLKLGLSVGVTVGEFGDTGDVQDRSIGPELLQDCHLETDLLLLIGRESDCRPVGGFTAGRLGAVGI